MADPVILATDGADVAVHITALDTHAWTYFEYAISAIFDEKSQINFD